MRVCIAIGARVVRTTGAVIGGAWDGVAWLGIDEGYCRYFSFRGSRIRGATARQATQEKSTIFRFG